MSTTTMGSNKITTSIPLTKTERLSWYQQQVDANDIAPARNKPDASMSHDNQNIIIYDAALDESSIASYTDLVSTLSSSLLGSTIAIASNQITVTIPVSKQEKLEWNEEEVHPNNIAPVRNIPHNTMYHGDGIDIDFDPFNPTPSPTPTPTPTPSGDGTVVTVTDTLDSHGGIVRTITAVSLAGDTITADTILKGYTAHDHTGQPIVGTYEPEGQQESEEEEE